MTANELQVSRLQPLRRYKLHEVVKITGYSRPTIFRRLAEDRMNETPGRSFPVPVKSQCRKQGLEWPGSALNKFLGVE